jgi:hypothetical protein
VYAQIYAVARETGADGLGKKANQHECRAVKTASSIVNISCMGAPCLSRESNMIKNLATEGQRSVE